MGSKFSLQTAAQFQRRCIQFLPMSDSSNVKLSVSCDANDMACQPFPKCTMNTYPVARTQTIQFSRLNLSINQSISAGFTANLPLSKFKMSPQFNDVVITFFLRVDKMAFATPLLSAHPCAHTVQTQFAQVQDLHSLSLASRETYLLGKQIMSKAPAHSKRLCVMLTPIYSPT